MHQYIHEKWLHLLKKNQDKWSHKIYQFAGIYTHWQPYFASEGYSTHGCT
jgi:hypothetical protein